MKKTLTILVFLLTAGILSAGTDLFFSEYIEGGGSNKALEIYNGTGQEVDLSNYIIKINYNGNPYNEIFSFPANATLASGDVYVIAHADADSAITVVADTLVVNPYSGGTSYVVSFNGDDVRALCKVNGTDTTVVDMIGLYDLTDPGSGWAVAGISDATKDHTLVRKGNVTTGNTDWNASAGTSIEDSEWLVYDKDTFDYIGSHTVVQEESPFQLSLTFEDDSDVANWSHWDEGNVWTSEAQNATAGVDGTGALELGDGGYAFLDKRKVYAVPGQYFALSVSIKTEGWASPDTYKLFLYAQDFAQLDSVQVNSDSGFTTFTMTGLVTADSGYIRIAGSNTAGQNYVWVDNLLFDGDVTPPAVDNIFFSEYIEGGGNNKALEIFNGGTEEVDLSNYIIRINYNGNPYNEVFSFPANAKLASGDVYVIAHADADSLITVVADTLVVNPYSGGTSYVVSFNGDDVRALCKVNGTDTTVVDIIGLYDLTDPGSGWAVAGISDATKDHTLVRKATVAGGNSDWSLSAGTTADDSEWMVYDKDTFQYLGLHPGSRDLPKPEPSEYPTNVTAVTEGTSILLKWDASAGTDLPDGYLGMMNTTGVFTAPVDGVPVEDGEGVGNIPFGVDSILVTGLEPETIYYFTIYPYSNSGTAIDYKTDGTPPVVSDTTGTGPNPILMSDFESGLGDWTPISSASNNNWEHATGTGANGSNGFAQMNGYQEDVQSNDYLIAGPFNFNNFTNEFMEFWTSTKYGNFDAELTLEYSTDFDGSSDPSTFTWMPLNFDRPTDNNDTWTHSGMVALDSISSDAVYIAFHYQSNGTDLGRWKIDDIGIYGNPVEGTDLPPVVVSVERNVVVPDANQNTEVSAVITDDNQVASATLVYSTDGENFFPVNMVDADSVWVGTVPESAYNDGDLFGYFVIANDNIGQADTSYISMLYAGNSTIRRIKENLDDDGSLMFDGVTARVTGTVSAGTGTYSSGRIEAYMQDSTAGILVIKFGTTIPEMVESNNYTVTGKIIMYNGLIELEPITPETDIVDNGTVDPLEPMEVSIEDLLAEPENFESRLVKILGANLSSGTPWLETSSTSGSTMDVYVGTDTLALRVDADTDIWGTASPEFPQDIIGVLGQYDRDAPFTSGYQIMPRRTTDFETPTSVEDENAIPTVYALEQNYPNPFNPTTNIKFSLPSNGFVTLKVYDILGNEIATLVNKEMKAANYTINFDASSLSTGVYLYRIQVNNFVSVKKMLLMK